MVNTIEAVKSRAKPSMPHMVSIEKLLHAEKKLGFFKKWVKENFNGIIKTMRQADWLNIMWVLQTQFGYNVNRIFREAVAPELLRRGTLSRSPGACSAPLQASTALLFTLTFSGGCWTRATKHVRLPTLSRSSIPWLS